MDGVRRAADRGAATTTLVATAVAAPWGPVHLAATTRGIAAIELTSPREAFEERLVRRFSATPTWLLEPGPRASPDGSVAGAARAQFDAAARMLDAAATAIGAALAADSAGDPADDDRAALAEALDRLPLDLDDRPAWDRAVLEAVRAIPRGEVRSYGQIARAIDRPGAARAVGGAVGRNPVGFLVPCHRVIAGDGTLGGYGGGWWGDHERLLDIKAELLAREGVHLPRSRSRGLPAG